MSVSAPDRRTTGGNSTNLPPSLLVALLGIGIGGALGVAVAIATPLYVVAGLIGLAGFLVLISSVRAGLIGFVAVATLLPFVVIPIEVGPVKFTLVDITIYCVLLVWIARLLTDRRESLRASGIDLQLFLYLAVCVTAFVLGTAYQLTVSDARLFAKFLTSVVFFFAVVNSVRELKLLRLLMNALVIGGAVASAIAVGLYYLPAPTATRLLASLARFGYPPTGILQYDAGTNVLKAIGTSIDHNILGATLMMCATLAVGMLVRSQRRRDRIWLFLALGVTLVGLLLTYSRGSLFGFLVGGAIIATFRFRRLWLIVPMLVVAIALFPSLAESSFVTHIETGIQIQDKATAMRFGEYKDAIRLIVQYPWFGVGFGSSPDVDLYIGVSSIYFLMAENVGLVGLALWAWTIGSVVVQALRQLVRTAPRDSWRAAGPNQPPTEASTIAVGCLGTLASVLVAGLFDHHFVDIHFPHVVAMVWMIVGLLVVALRLDRERTEARIEETGTGVDEMLSVADSVS
jgi:O-antigen ligase